MILGQCVSLSQWLFPPGVNETQPHPPPSIPRTWTCRNPCMLPAHRRPTILGYREHDNYCSWVRTPNRHTHLLCTFVFFLVFILFYNKCLTHSDQPLPSNEMDTVFPICIVQMGKLRHSEVTLQPGSSLTGARAQVPTHHPTLPLGGHDLASHLLGPVSSGLYS